VWGIWTEEVYTLLAPDADQADQAISPSDTKLDHLAPNATIALPKLIQKMNGF
jgi:hypothetical protein